MSRTEVFTVEQIAGRLQQPRIKIDAMLRQHHVQPATRVGNVRLFDEAALELIRTSLAERSGVNPTDPPPL